MEDNPQKPTDDYAVGYGRPPKASQFQPGHKPHPKAGRPPHSPNKRTALDKDLARRVTVVENGKRKKITKEEIIARKLTQKAMDGDVYASKEVHRQKSKDSPSHLIIENKRLKEKIQQLELELANVKEEKKGGLLVLPKAPVNDLERMIVETDNPQEILEYVLKNPESFLEMVSLKSYNIFKPNPPFEEASQTGQPPEPFPPSAGD